MAEDSIDKMKNSSGSVIIPDETSVVTQIFRDKIDLVANAIGASISHISGQYEQIYIYSQIEQEEALKDAEQKAREQATLDGAVTDLIEVVEVEEIPLAYHPTNATRLRVKVVGNLI